MAKKDNNLNGNENHTNGLNIGEIGTIRNILMGDQISEYEIKFRELEEQIATLKSTLFLKIQESNKHNQDSINASIKELENSLEKIGIKVEENNTTIDDLKINNKKDRKVLGNLFLEISNKLLDQ